MKKEKKGELTRTREKQNRRIPTNLNFERRASNRDRGRQTALTRRELRGAILMDFHLDPTGIKGKRRERRKRKRKKREEEGNRIMAIEKVN